MLVNLNDPVDLALLALAPTSNLNRPPSGSTFRRVSGRPSGAPRRCRFRFPQVDAPFFAMPVEFERVFPVLVAGGANDTSP